MSYGLTPSSCNHLPHLICGVNKANRDGALNAFPDEFDRIEVWRIGGKIDKQDVIVFRSLLQHDCMMTAEVVENNNDDSVFGVGRPNLWEKFNDGNRLGVFKEIMDTVTGDSIEADRVGFAFGGVFGDLAFAEMPNAYPVGR